MEGYNGKNGWAITSGRLYDRADLQEIADANQLYDMLEYKISELFYSRNEMDVPESWVAMMKNSIYSTCQDFNMNRVLCEYFRKMYIPARDSSDLIAKDNYSVLKRSAEQEQAVMKQWDQIEITSLTVGQKNSDEFTEGRPIEVSCGVRLGLASVELFTVELFYMYGKDEEFKVLPMELSHSQDNITFYRLKLEFEGYGSQSLNVRIRPADEIVRDSHPELIKWKD